MNLIIKTEYLQCRGCGTYQYITEQACDEVMEREFRRNAMVHTWCWG